MIFKFSVEGEETYNGVDCWLLTVTTSMEEEGAEMKIAVTWWMDKSSFEVLHGRMEMYMDNDLIYREEFEPAQTPEEAGEPPKPVDLSYSVGSETITVIAGTFENCIKTEVTTEGRTVHVWVHPDVPVWGVVKTEGYEDGEKILNMELISYGG